MLHISFRFFFFFFFLYAQLMLCTSDLSRLARHTLGRTVTRREAWSSATFLQEQTGVRRSAYLRVRHTDRETESLWHSDYATRSDIFFLFFRRSSQTDWQWTVTSKYSVSKHGVNTAAFVLRCMRGLGRTGPGCEVDWPRDFVYSAQQEYEDIRLIFFSAWHRHTLISLIQTTEWRQICYVPLQFQTKCETDVSEREKKKRKKKLIHKRVYCLEHILCHWRLSLNWQ